MIDLSPAALGLQHLGLFVLAGIALNLTPGPDVLYVLTHGAKSGLRAGSAAALGIVAGCFVHITAAALGVSALLAASSAAFTALKWLGAAYLVYVGLSLLRAKAAAGVALANADHATGSAPVSGPLSTPLSLRTIFINGFWTNALNPKVALFFLAFVPQFIAPDAAHKTLAFWLLGLVFNLNSLWVNLGYAWLSASAGAALAGSAAHGPAGQERATPSRLWAWLRARTHWLERAVGTAFVAFGLRLALMDNLG